MKSNYNAGKQLLVLISDELTKVRSPVCQLYVDFIIVHYLIDYSLARIFALFRRRYIVLDKYWQGENSWWIYCSSRTLPRLSSCRLRRVSYMILADQASWLSINTDQPLVLPIKKLTHQHTKYSRLVQKMRLSWTWWTFAEPTLPVAVGEDLGSHTGYDVINFK